MNIFSTICKDELVMLKKLIKKVLGRIMRLLPLDLILLFSQKLCDLVAQSLMLRDWTLQANGRPQFFKHHINLSRWRFEPTQWSFTARGVYARENMFRGCSVLDLCCGDGSYSHLFFSDIAGKIDAVDNDSIALSYAKRYSSASPIQYHKIDIINQPLPATQYDVVVWNAAICYFTEPQIRVILKKIVSAGNDSMILCGALPMANGHVDHKTEFSDAESIRTFLREYFGVVEIREIDEISTRSFYFRASNPFADHNGIRAYPL